MNWIRVEERLPDEGPNEVHVTVESDGKRSRGYGVYLNGRWWSLNGLSYEAAKMRVISWMPLPEPDRRP